MPEGNENAPVVTKPAGQGKWLLVIVVALISSIGAGAVSWLVASRLSKPSPAAQVETEHAAVDPIVEALEKGAALPLDPFVVNLADADAARYLRIKVSLMVDDKST